MSKRYKIWDKESDIICPSGEIFSAEQWMVRYPIAKLPNVTVLCAPGLTNGAIFGTLNDLRQSYEDNGYTFDDCLSEQEVLDKIEAIQYEEMAKAQEIEANTVSTDERIASALEAQVMLSMPDSDTTEV